jgi:nitrite reductase (NADH) small subunit
MTAVAVEVDAGQWEDVCGLEDIVPWTGVCALLAGRQVAIVRTDDAVYALDNFDPISKAYVLSRGIVGDRGGIPKIASPIFKQTFDLRTGRCLEKPDVQVATHEVRVERGRILVHREPRPPGGHDGA